MLTKNKPFAWVVTTAIAFMFLNLLMVSVGYLFLKGVGIWGNNVPVGWAFDIINFVWWIGIGHAGTLISAILLLFKQDWRTSINRFAEAMTLFAVACALMFPLHSHRPSVAGGLLAVPVSERMGIWPNFRSPLIWDVFAVSTYGTVSLLFWFIGLIPDLATFRDRAKNKVTKYIYGMPRARMARFGAALAALRERLPAARRPVDAAGALGAHGRQLRLRGRQSSRAGTRRSSRRTSSPARSTPASRWC